jgi:hypothetical protein
MDCTSEKKFIIPPLNKDFLKLVYDIFSRDERLKRVISKQSPLHHHHNITIFP